MVWSFFINYLIKLEFSLHIFTLEKNDCRVYMKNPTPLKAISHFRFDQWKFAFIGIVHDCYGWNYEKPAEKDYTPAEKDYTPAYQCLY